jgi:cobalt-zinc-cadmium efflux system protein
LLERIEALDGVHSLHHVHVWQLDEHSQAMEAHVVIEASDAGTMESIKHAIKARLGESFGIAHSTIEFEFAGDHGYTCQHGTSVIVQH